MKITTIFESTSTGDDIHNHSIDTGLYRGIDRVLDGPTKVPVRKDRQPMHSTVGDSILFNAAIELKFGIPDIRRRAVFGTTAYEVAQEYAESGGGCVATIHVTKQAKFVYNPSVADSMSICESILSTLEYTEGTKAVIEFLEKADYKSNALDDLEEACDTVSTGAEMYNTICEILKNVVSGYVAVPAQANVFTNMHDVEVMITGVDHIYLTPVEDDESYDPFD